MNYFDKIPTITYNGALCKNLLARARLSDQTRDIKSVFYPYTMENADRIDILSNDYYDSPGYTWLIWLTNNTIDPYYDMALDEDNFIDYMIKKYGSFDSAARKIYFYRNNWYDYPDTQISIAQFDALSSSFKKYYEPIIDNSLAPAAYKRKRHDDVVATNKIITLEISNASGTFTVGEEIQVNASNYAFVTFANSSVVTCQHVTGSLTTADAITGQTSAVTADIDTVNVIAETIASTDAAYWTPVTYLDYEQEQNESKKTIQLLDPRYVGQAESDLRRVMGAR